MRAALGGSFDLVLPAQVIVEAQRHLMQPTRATALRAFLEAATYEELPVPSAEQVRQHQDLVRSAADAPIAVALLTGDVDVFVSSDRDFTDSAATAERFQRRVRVMLPAVFLREVVGWSSEALEAIRDRVWAELTPEDSRE